MVTNTPYFGALDGEQFIVLTTYRRDGTPMPTCVWFAEAGDRLYITTMGQAGKTKRVRANPQVTIAPSDQAGNVHGPVFAGRARVLDETDFAHANALLRAKYQPMYDGIVGRTDASNPAGSRVFLVVERPEG